MNAELMHNCLDSHERHAAPVWRFSAILARIYMLRLTYLLNEKFTVKCLASVHVTGMCFFAYDYIQVCSCISAV